MNSTRYFEPDDNVKGLCDENKNLQNLLLLIEQRAKNKSLNGKHVENLIKPLDNNAVSSEFDSAKRKPKKCKTENRSDSSVVIDNSAHHGTFTIIEPPNFEKKEKVECVLPNWLACPKIISANLTFTTNVRDMALLDERLKEKLKKNGITQFFPVQSSLIPWILKSHLKDGFWSADACVCTPTGSGKTLSYALPIIQVLSSRGMVAVRALIIVPTKCLASQVYEVFRKYTVGYRLKVIQLGRIAKFEKEQANLVRYVGYGKYEALADIVITTPGRLTDHMFYTKHFTLQHLKYLVVDEADNVMTSSARGPSWFSALRHFLPYIGSDGSAPAPQISTVKQMPRRTQRLFFSATLSQDPEALQSYGLFEPVLFMSAVDSEVKLEKATNRKKVKKSLDVPEQEQRTFIGKYIIPKELDEYMTLCSLPVKPVVLYYWIKYNNLRNVICFVDRVSNVDRLRQLLTYLSSNDSEMETSLTVKGLSSKLNAKEQAAVVSEFSKNKIDVLITTDTMARGIDLRNVMCVMIYDAPKHALTYVHRVGRTARAGKEGTAFTLVTPDEKSQFLDILSSTGQRTIKAANPDMALLKKIETAYKSALKELSITVKKENRVSMKKLAKAKAGWKETKTNRPRYRIRNNRKFKSANVKIKSKAERNKKNKKPKQDLILLK